MRPADQSTILHHPHPAIVSRRTASRATLFNFPPVVVEDKSAAGSMKPLEPRRLHRSPRTAS
ncbi:MAG: hypothetical protein MPL62_05750, partial [Alphaproteobacteria bacterium]|nr:hypothetical protein [Alphaproteobacteria bacterium]